MNYRLCCVICGKSKEFWIDSTELDIGKPIRSLIEEQGWFVQRNYPYTDIYCCRRCAE